MKEFHCLFDIENPDVVVGTESWLNPDIAISEIFPGGYRPTVFRADRKSKASHGAGVFILVRNGLLCTDQPQFQADCELLWMKLEITGTGPLFIGAYYRHREDNLESLQELQNSVGKVGEHSDNIWILGDFNLPKLQRPDCEPVVKPDCSFKQVYDQDNNGVPI